jgi:hypothetical protein
MVSPTAFPFTLDFHTSEPVVEVPVAEQDSCDGELLPFRELDEWLGLTRQFAEALEDRRHESYVKHSPSLAPGCTVSYCVLSTCSQLHLSRMGTRCLRPRR